MTRVLGIYISTIDESSYPLHVVLYVLERVSVYRWMSDVRSKGSHVTMYMICSCKWL